MAMSNQRTNYPRRWPNVDSDRSRVMSAVRQKDTKPEMIVRRLVHGMGYRYALHRKDLPGKPDLVFASKRKVIFVHGCFWHGHTKKSCTRSRVPKTRVEFWRAKIERNAARDATVQKMLRDAGWRILAVWECETGTKQRCLLARKLRNFLES